MSAGVASWCRAVVLVVGTTLVMLLLSDFRAFASIDIRDLDNANAINVRVTEERTRIEERTPHVNPRTPTQPRSQDNADRGAERHISTDIRSGFSIGPTTTLRCSIALECERSLLADRPEDSVADRAEPPAVTPPVVVEEPVEIVITSSDLLELIPSTPQILMDRGPFGLKNAHTNFYASDHQSQTITRTMFGQEVTITATPIEHRWDYGDGSTLVTESPGHPVEVFNTETETSHQYTEPGLYTVTMATVFEGTYQVDGGPVETVSSTVTQDADPVEIRIWRAVTRNVDQTCLENPEAWGC